MDFKKDYDKNKVVLIKNYEYETKYLKDKDCKKVLELGLKIINQFNLNYLLSAGTVLGLYRDEKFIDYDTDIDIEIFVENKIDINKLKTEFINNGFIVSHEQYYDNNIMQLLLINKEEDIYLDIYFYYQSELPHIIYNYTMFGILYLDKFYIDNKQLWLGYYLPFPIENYLDSHYKNWKEPENKKPCQWS